MGLSTENHALTISATMSVCPAPFLVPEVVVRYDERWMKITPALLFFFFPFLGGCGGDGVYVECVLSFF